MSLPDDTLRAAQALLGHDFADPALLEEALTHTSAAHHRLKSNERMEFLGDAVLDLVVCERIYALFPDREEGDLTKLKSTVVSRRTCATIARETGLADLLIVGKGITGRQEIPGSLAANVYESIVAALHLDGGIEAARRYVLATMGPHIEAVSEAEHGHNYKARLAELSQEEWGQAPQYELLDEQGPDHSKCFEVCVRLDGQRYGGAWAPNKKSAEQKAALIALRDLGEITEAEYGAAVDVVDALTPTAV